MGVFPIHSLLSTRFGREVDLCSLCGEEEETAMQIFVHCSVTKRVAFASK